MRPQTLDEKAVRAVYNHLIEAWNNRDASAYAGHFAENGHVVGFDGSVVDGAQAILTHIGQIFADHMTASYLAIIREVRFLSPDIALLRAVVGMIPPGQADINPAANAIQSLIVVNQNNKWQIELFHNTPAQFHGRPDLVEALTEELRDRL